MVKDTFWQQLYINIWGKSLEKIIGRGIHKSKIYKLKGYCKRMIKSKAEIEKKRKS